MPTHPSAAAAAAGRRSTDLAHLLLQNLYMMHHCRGYTGTSSVMALALLHPLMAAQGYTQQRRASLVGRLVGTHAHEMTSMVQQLLVEYDARAGRLAGLEVRGSAVSCRAPAC